MFSKKQKAIKFNLTAEEFLTDLIPLLNDIVLKIKQKNIDDYDSGRVFAYDVLSIIQMQAKNFDIDLHAIGLEYELTEDLVSTSVATN